MGALTFDKNELGNLEYSLQREMLATDRRGGYMSTTIVCCNTRKYHGLIVAPIDESDRDFVLLSSLDETILHGDHRFNLALHRFDGIYEPRGHKYITDFEYTPTPTITYRIGDLVLKKELLWIHKRTQLMVRYTLVESQTEDPITLQLRPFLAFRDRHALSKANMYADGKSYPVVGGVKCKLYDGFPWLYMQVSKREFEYVPAPDWYYNFEYQQESARGYEAHEDLLTPGYFELELSKGESVIFSASTDEVFSADVIKESYELSVKRRTHKVDFSSCLQHSARQFIVRRADGRADVEAGYPWYGVVGRQSMFALPGLTFEQGNIQDCTDVLDNVVNHLNSDTLAPSFHPYHAVDTLLWFFRTLQALDKKIGRDKVWERYGDAMIHILEMYRVGVGDRVALHDNGLIWAWSNDESISWTDPTIAKGLAKSRNGYQVEVNALWYNAVCYTLSMAEEFGNHAFVEEWEHMPLKTKSSFLNRFWCEDGWLANSVNYDFKNVAIRSNMIVACALEYKMLSEVEQIEVIRTINQHLLTPKGLRSLSPISHVYGRGFVKDTNSVSVWVWPLALYVKACFDISGINFLQEAKQIRDNFIDEIQLYGIGSIGEYFDSDPPHASRGAISQAWSVSAVLEIVDMIAEWEAKVEAPKPKRAPRKSTAKSATTKAAPKAKSVVKPKMVAKPKAAAKRTTKKSE